MTQSHRHRDRDCDSDSDFSQWHGSNRDLPVTAALTPGQVSRAGPAGQPGRPGPGRFQSKLIQNVNRIEK